MLSIRLLLEIEAISRLPSTLCETAVPSPLECFSIISADLMGSSRRETTGGMTLSVPTGGSQECGFLLEFFPSIVYFNQRSYELFYENPLIFNHI